MPMQPPPTHAQNYTGCIGMERFKNLLSLTVVVRAVSGRGGSCCFAGESGADVTTIDPDVCSLIN